MTLTTTSPAPMVIPHLQVPNLDKVRVTPITVLKSEWLKLRTLRSSWALMIIAFGALAGIGIALSWSTIADFSHMHGRELDHFNALTDSMTGFELSTLAIGVLGILFMAGEYSTGQIRSSLGAVPKRLPVLFTKAGLLAILTFVTMLPAALITFFVSQKILSKQHIQTTWSTPTVARTVIGVALYLTVIAVIGVGLGALIRNIAGGIAAFVGIMIVLPAIAGGLPVRWGDRINKYLPSNAGRALLNFQSDFQSSNLNFKPWTGFTVFVAYALALLAIAAVMLKRRDA
jgi:ABC-2 type transport system permease protein